MLFTCCVFVVVVVVVIQSMLFVLLYSYRLCTIVQTYVKGAQWLSVRVFDSRPKGRGFEPHRRHCVMVLEQGTFILA